MTNLIYYLERHKRSIETSFRLLIAFTFVLSGLMKGVNLHAAAQTVRNYSGLLGLSLHANSSYVLAFIVCVFEIWLGLLAFDNKSYRKLYPIYTMVILAFTILTYVNLNSPFGLSESCGCFGELISLNTTETFVKNVILLCLVIILDVQIIIKINPLTNENQNRQIPFYRYFLICGVCSLLPIVLSALCMNRIDDRVFLTLYVAISAASVLLAIITRFKNLYINNSDL